MKSLGELTQFLSQRRLSWPWLIFALGLGVFLYFQLDLVAKPYLYRSLPVESDDAYAYVVKSAELFECPSQDCPALKDLRTQLLPRPNDPWPLAIEKWTRYVRLYTYYHPLYSLGLWGLVKLEGISCEEAYRQISVLGSLGLAAAISFFLVSLVGPLAAGIALFSIAPLVFPGQEITPAGIYSTVPSTLSLGIGLLMFAYLARRDGRPGLTFYGLNLLAMGLHPVGLIHTGLAVAFGITCRYPRDGLRFLKGFAPSLVLMASFWGLIHLVPQFIMIPLPVPDGFSYLREVLRNFKHLFFFYPKVFLLVNGWPRELFLWSVAPRLVGITQVLGLCLGITSLLIKAGERRNVLLTATILLLVPSIITLGAAIMLLLVLFRGLLDSEPGKLRLPLLAMSVLFMGVVISCLHVLPDAPANLLDRLYVFWALGAAAVLGRGLVLMAEAPGLGQVLPRYVPVSLVKQTSTHPWFWRALLLVFVLFYFLPQKNRDRLFMSNVMSWSIDRYDMALDAAQPLHVVKLTSPGDVILYDRDATECIQFFFLTHGCLERRAVYLPYLPLPSDLKFDPAHVKILVGTNPFLLLCQNLNRPPSGEPYLQLETLKNYLALPPGASLTLQLDPAMRPEAVEILNLPGNLTSPGQHLLLTRQAAGHTETSDLDLPPGVWARCPLSPQPGGSLSLSNTDKKLTVALGGLRLQPGNDSIWRWPWEGVKEVTWHDPSASRSQSYAPRLEISFQGHTYRMMVLQDKGASVVWKLTLMPPEH